MIEAYLDWLARWNAASEADLHSLLDELDKVILSLISGCEYNGLDTSELRVLLAKQRAFSGRILNKRQDVPEQLDSLVSRIEGELDQQKKTQTSSSNEIHAETRDLTDAEYDAAIGKLGEKATRPNLAAHIIHHRSPTRRRQDTEEYGDKLINKVVKDIDNLRAARKSAK